MFFQRKRRHRWIVGIIFLSLEVTSLREVARFFVGDHCNNAFSIGIFEGNDGIHEKNSGHLEVIKITENEYNQSNGVNTVEDYAFPGNFYLLNLYLEDEEGDKSEIEFVNLHVSSKTRAQPAMYIDDKKQQLYPEDSDSYIFSHYDNGITEYSFILYEKKITNLRIV